MCAIADKGKCQLLGARGMDEEDILDPENHTLIICISDDLGIAAFAFTLLGTAEDHRPLSRKPSVKQIGSRYIVAKHFRTWYLIPR